MSNVQLLLILLIIWLFLCFGDNWIDRKEKIKGDK